MIRRSHLAALAAAFVTSACGAAESLPQRLRVQVVAAHPHDPSAFTQGLIIDGEGRLLESTGRYGVSDVRVVDIATGAVLDRTPIAADLFGEGLARVGDRLVQLTWQERKALVFDAATLDLLSITFAYDTEGWGLCYDGERLVMSDGSSTLTFRAPDTFDRLGAALVTLGGAPLDELNELECAGGRVYANIWGTDTIVEIDPSTGRVTSEIDASGLLSSEERAQTHGLNGIAAVPGKDTFYITGKLWPKLFEVRFVSR